MTALNRMRKIAFLSTYPPRECGLATFTQDLVNAMATVVPLIKPVVIAINNSDYYYDDKVIMEIRQHDRNSYLETARKINHSDIELVVIEHEYGIFGGECGEYILDLVENLQVPVVTTLHTVLPNPSEKQLTILRVLGHKSTRLVTMARNTLEILENTYGIDRSKVEVIHHGVPFRNMEPREKLKEKHGYKDHHVISTFGLISPGKGLEYGIEAVAKVVQDYKNVIYLILGKTHPCVKQQSGEQYRQQLMEMVKRLGIEEHVKFVDKYLTKEEIIYYLQLSDIYLTPYLGKDQAVSGTLAYAVGYGRVVVSTPYSYAKEMLGGGRGLLAEFRDANSLARCIKYVIANPDKKQEMEKRTLFLGRTMTWGNVATQYVKLFINIMQQGRTKAEVG
ncbi:glycosyltransferase family 4 protein [Sporolituus thermophilus]|uniref:Glycosyltransferase involved in cell wall bisynthesis n=1 Tax=Sporolituus thermophilus DSM 23256 TaxID=1123285 RepID=A0A1G7MYB4_9FIRM|nr:glycosyltransferase family 4 protein [Sporolituus thermophilus]SDF66677.1 Glycosyltransferase involved in cell wall bisynthesis [Sporolituus thermophilus DSM 23256]